MPPGAGIGRASADPSGETDDAPAGTPTTRTRIADDALAMFLESGFAATSLRMIADRVGVTQAAVYYHFRAKDDLLVALLERPLDEFDRVLDDAECRRVAEGLVDRRALLAAVLDQVVEHRDVICLLRGDVIVARHPQWEPRIADLSGRCRHLLSGATDEPDPGSATLAAAALAVLTSAPDGSRELLLDAALRVLDTPRGRYQQA